VSTARRAVAALLALLIALAVGGAAGWGLHHANASTAAVSMPSPSPTASPTAAPSVSPTPQASPSTAAQPARKRIVLIGDSLTYGSGLDAPQDLPSLVRSLHPELDVISVAVGGQESRDLLGRVRQFRLLHADEAVIWVGGQDADDRVAVDSFRSNVDKLVTALAPAHVVLVTPIPDYAVGATLFVPFAAATRDLAHQRNLQLIDLGTMPRSSYQSDSTHLDAATEQRVAGLYAKVL
jgi:lysophospholipase L1-like esterase